MAYKANAKSIDLHKVQMDAEQAYKDGFFCDEAVLETIINNFEVDIPHEVICLVSGMSVGVGRSGCMCGAANGGVAAIGMLFGRDKKLGPKDPDVNKCMAMTHELHEWFTKTNGKNSMCCRVLTKEFNMAEGEHKPQCIYFTGLAAYKTAEILARELGLPVTNDELVLKKKEELHAA